ncbi:hypothetical protein ATANTOWER_030352 [Ataeniobius toweri]|uniref:Uncharacterized protein n=1 Tax=Ataeniobius toweri TaxID=208326 RepID=A0ABU7BIS0_9TELE|nr:hypothetical protein [Ataeniobius toweri]
MPPPCKTAPCEKTNNIHIKEHMPDTQTPARSSPTRKPTSKSTEGRQPTEPNQNQPSSRDHSTPKTTPVTPSTQIMQIPPPTRTKNRLTPPKAAHPPQKKSYNQPNIWTTPRTH